MPDPIEDLSQRWKRNPDAASTIALCEALRNAPRPTLVQQVGELATRRHGGQVPVLLAVARMYLDAARLSDAQTVLVAAGKLAPREGGVYRWLGEVLLRRGDAERAEKVLERAAQLGSQEPDTALWLERARSFKIIQAEAGIGAVAKEVAAADSPAARPASDSFGDEVTTDVRSAPLKAIHAGPESARKYPTTAETAPFATLVGDIRTQLEQALTLSTGEVGEDALISARPAPPPQRSAPLPPAPARAKPAPAVTPPPPEVVRPPPPLSAPPPPPARRNAAPAPAPVPVAPPREGYRDSPYRERREP